MAIEGPLRELSLPDVLQLVHLSRKTGTLTVRADGTSGMAGRAGRLFFEQGAVVGAQAPGDGSRLGRLLLMAGKATAAQVGAAVAEQRRAPGRRIGEILVREGVSRAEVERQLRFQVEETLFELVRWSEGYVRFEETPPLDPGPVRIRLATESLLLEALRRVDEWTELASGQPDTSLVPRLVEGAAAPGPVLDLLPMEWEVLAATDGVQPLRGIARALGRGEFEVAKAVFALVSAGVVELKKGAPRVAKPREDGSAVRKEAEALLAGGREAAEGGRWGEAMALYQRAAKRDPLLAAVYQPLGVAALRAGETARAAEAFATLARLPDADAPERERASRAAALLRELERILEEGE